MLNALNSPRRLLTLLPLLLVLLAGGGLVFSGGAASAPPEHANPGGRGGDGDDGGNDDPPEDAPAMFVEFVRVDWSHSGGRKKQPHAHVWIIDEFGEPVPDALVEGVFLGGEEGLCLNSDKEASAVTEWVTYNAGEDDEYTVAEANLEPNGQGVNCSNCDFAFVVTKVTHSEYVYDSDQNLVDSHSTPCSILD